MPNLIINIAKDFSPTPGPRYMIEGDFSGELFRDKFLFPFFAEAVKTNEKVIINLDGSAGYGTSFLEESFGGLIRSNHISFDDIVSHLEIISDEEPYLKEDIVEYLKDANQHK